MKKHSILLFTALVSILYCSPKQDHSSIDDTVEFKTFPDLKETFIDQLPDSLQPENIALNTKPKPKTVLVPKGSSNAVTMSSGGISHFTNFTTDNGLVLDFMNSSYMDRQGNLWFGTNGSGVSKYDGTSFVTYTPTQGLATNGVLCIIEDKRGNLWFGTDGGVSKYDGASFTTYTTAQGLVNNTVRSMTEDKKGNLWLGTDGGISSYDGKTFTNYTTARGLVNNTVRSITEDKNGNLWFGTDGGISSYDGKTFTNYTSAQGLVNNAVRSITEDKIGNLWFGTRGGASKYDGKSFTSFTTTQGLVHNIVYCIIPDKAENLWFGTYGGGVSKYDGKSFTSFTTAQGLANNTVISITEDKAGNIWFATLGGGMSKYNGSAITNYTSTQGLANNILNTITEDKAGNLWFGTMGGGVSKYDGKSFTNFTTVQGLADNSVLTIYRDHDGNLWFGTLEGGASKYDGKSFTNFTTVQGLLSNYVHSIVQDKTGNIWLGTFGAGVSKYDGKSFTNFTTAQGLADNYVLNIIEDKAGNLWFGTRGGVSKYDGKSFLNFTADHGLANSYVFSITEDSNGNFWFGTDGGGVSRLANKELEKLKSVVQPAQRKTQKLEFENFSTAQGLANDVVYDIIQDKQGNIVFATNLGFTLIPAEFSTQPFTKIRQKIEYYNVPNGYPVKDAFANSMYCDKQGVIWLGTSNEKTALVRFDYAAIRKTQTPPILYIKKIKVNGGNICWFDLQRKGELKTAVDTLKAKLQESMTYGKMLSEKERDSINQRFGAIQFDSISQFYQLPIKLVLPYKYNQVTFDFNTIETDKPQLVNYQYILEGYDKTWSPVLKNTSANFGNINEGRYTFKVKAQGPNGIWCTPVVYTFSVLPPWYRSWWAYLSYTIAFLGALRIFSKWRERNLRNEKENLEKTVEERTNTLTATLKNLKSTQAQLIQSEKLASLGELTAGIAHEIQNPLNFVNNFSEINAELIDELEEEVTKGNHEDALAIVADLKMNEKKIAHHGQRASAIVKGMLDHSRVRTGIKELTDLNALANEYFRLATQEFSAKNQEVNISLSSYFDPNLPKLEVVPQDIGRVLLNLVNNALYAVCEKSNQAQESYVPKVSIGTYFLKNSIEIKVADNGGGIPDSIREKIFQPFFTTKPAGQGTGLGLSLAYDTVKAHGGDLNVETKEGEGTEFVIRFPIVN